MERGFFSLPDNIREATEDFKLRQHPFSHFRKTHLIERDNGLIKKKELMEKVNRYLSSNGYNEVTDVMLGKLMVSYFPSVNTDCRDKDRNRCFGGVDLI